MNDTGFRAGEADEDRLAMIYTGGGGNLVAMGQAKDEIITALAGDPGHILEADSMEEAVQKAFDAALDGDTEIGGGVPSAELEAEIQYAQLLLDLGKKKEAAEVLGISRRAIHYKIKKYGIDAGSIKARH